MRMPMGFPPAALESVAEFVPRDGDVFVVSYPKSGTTWLQYIVHLLLGRPPLGRGESLSEAFPHLEEVGAAAFDSVASPRLIKTHLGRAMTPFSAACRYLVIVRNPFDCAVSFYHHTRGFPRHYDFADGSFADFFECFIAGEVDFGDYFDHLESWLAEVGRNNLLWLSYEALALAPAPEIRRIAAFLGPTALAAVPTDAALRRVVDETSLGSMQRDQARWSSARPAWAAPFVRRGGIGDWRSLFTPRQARALLAKFDRRLAGNTVADPWSPVLSDVRAFAEPAD